MNKLSQTLEKLMSDKGITETELSRKTGISQPVINRLACGENKNPQLSTLVPIANYFGISVSQLIGDEKLNEKKSSDKEEAEAIKRIPIIEWEEISKWIDDKLKITPQAYMLTHLDISKNGYALKINEKFINPAYPNESILIVDPLLKPKNKNFVIIQFFGHTPIFRQILLDLNNVYLKPLDPDFKTIFLDGNYKIFGVVLRAVTMLN